MNIIEKIDSLRQHRADRKNELFYGGRISKAGAVRQMSTTCSICEKEFSISNKKLNYFYDLNAGLHFMCDKCYQKFIDAYTVISCEKIVPHGGYQVGGTAWGCKMKDGSVRDMPYGASESTYGEIPKIFSETLKPFIKKYYDDLAAKEIKEVTVEDTYDKQVIRAEFNSGKKYDIHFKIGTAGNVIYNPADTKDISDDEIVKINAKLKDLGVFNHRI